MAESFTRDVIRLRHPLKPEYLPVLRAAVGVLAGAMAFNYDEIMQLRVAVSELFDVAVRSLARQKGSPESAELDIHFVVRQDGLEILVVSLPNGMGRFDSREDQESQALLESLMDTVEMDREQAAVRMVMRKASGT